LFIVVPHGIVMRTLGCRLQLEAGAANEGQRRAVALRPADRPHLDEYDAGLIGLFRAAAFRVSPTQVSEVWSVSAEQDCP
jgi:hypothetical protein